MGMDTLAREMSGDAKGFYNQVKAFNDANETQISWTSYFSEHAKKQGVYAEEAIVARREEHFLRKFKVRPEEFDRDRRVREHARDTWAIEKYFAEHGCPIYGDAAPAAGKAFTSGTLQGVFPIFFESALREGLLQSSIRNRLVAETVPTNSGV